MIDKLKTLFTEHPKSVGATYLSHAIFAAFISMKIILMGAALLVHAILPFTLQTYAKKSSLEIAEILNTRHKDGN